MCQSAQRQFSAEISAPRATRRFAVDAITTAVPGAGATVVEDCELLVGELVTNAVNAAASTVDVSVEVHHDRVELAVTDDARGWPVLLAPDQTATSGRGLQIVAALSTRWGVTLGEDRSTTVWAELSCDPFETTDLKCRFR